MSNAIECAEEETRDECYEDAYEDGRDEGRTEATNDMLQRIANEVIELKQRIKDEDLNGKDLQVALTEMVLDIDCDDFLFYKNKDRELKQFDL